VRSVSGPIPRPAQKRLLEAALFAGDEAVRAWREWRGANDPATIDRPSRRLLPAVYANLEGAGYRNLVVPGLDHWTLPTSRRVFRCVKEVLQAGSGRWPTPHLATVEPSPSRARCAAPRPISLVRSAARLGR